MEFFGGGTNNYISKYSIDIYKILYLPRATEAKPYLIECTTRCRYTYKVDISPDYVRTATLDEAINKIHIDLYSSYYKYTDYIMWP
jgi:hypothetical protein